MELFWEYTRRGQKLVLKSEEDGEEEMIGGVRETKNGLSLIHI